MRHIRPHVVGLLALSLSLGLAPLTAMAQARPSRPPPPSSQQCAAEGERCSFSGTKSVYYGAGSSWVVRRASDGIDCNNAQFGDPIVGTRKACFVLQAADSGGGTAAQVKGANVVRIAYTGSASGAFLQINEGLWAELKAGSSTLHAIFSEESRDEWSVYLRKSDGARVQLDLSKKEVIVNGSTLYTIAGSQGDTGERVKGAAVQVVGYIGNAAGSFVQMSRGQWAEFKAGSTTAHATFTEESRDEWSVYLRKSDGARVQLDLWKREVIVNGSTLYTIQQAG